MQQDKTLKQLRENGFRMGRIRKEIIALFALTTKPLSAQDIIRSLTNKHVMVNKTTVYRELDFLVEQKLVHELQLQSHLRHFESSEQNHHHHLVCEQCNTVVPIDDGVLEKQMTTLTKNVLQTKQFTIRRHALEFFGVCRNCN